MANLQAIHSVGNSLIIYLRNAYPEPLRSTQPCSFSLLCGSEVANVPSQGTTLSLFLYRVTFDQNLRNTGPAFDRAGNPPPLSVNLHYLLTVWADSASIEQTILAWAMHELQRRPVLDSSSLSPDAEWNAGDVVQIIPEERTTEDMMRVWDALEPSYRLSVSYVARVVRIDVGVEPEVPAVVATRFGWNVGVPES